MRCSLVAWLSGRLIVCGVSSLPVSVPPQRITGMRRRAPRISRPTRAGALFNQGHRGRRERVGCGAVPGANATEMAHASLDDGLVMQILSGYSVITTRGSSPSMVATWGRTFRVQ